MKSTKRLALATVAGLGIAAVTAGTATAEVSVETQYIFNTLSFLFHGVLVMWMAAGFAMLEAGLVRSKNVGTQCLKNIAIYAIAGIMYWLIGYKMMYGGATEYFGGFEIWSAGDPATAESLAAEDATLYSAGSDWFFQMVFVATAASIVSGTVAERVKLSSFFLFTVVLTALIYPIQGSWHWGQGWLYEMEFVDFAGSTLVHSVGGWAALAGAILIGPRKGKFNADGSINPMPGSSLPLATIGTFILWMGWFGFNGGSQLAMGTIDDVTAISTIYINTNLAAAAGVVVAMILTQLMYKKIDLTMVLNGAIAGLVSITADPLSPSPFIAIIIGGIGGALVVIAVPLIEKLKIDDVVGAVSAHLVCGIWGTFAVPIGNDEASFVTQIIGIVSIGLFVFVVSFVLWAILKYTIGIRVDEEAEVMGLDKADLGMEAYPEFGRGSQTL